MKRLLCFLTILIAAVFLLAPIARAHFQGLVPSDDMVTKSYSRAVSLDVIFFHPFEGHYMNMEKLAQFGVLVRGRKTDLLETLREKKVDVFSAWQAIRSLDGQRFQGVVKVNGKPAAGTEVEVEYYNKDGTIKAPADPMITQVIKADPNGVFTYVIPKAGWWGFAALNTDHGKIKRNGEEKSVEIGAVLWVRVHDMK